MSMDVHAGASGLTWDYSLPVLTNAFLWYDLAKVFVIVYIVILGLLTIVLGLSEGLAGVPDMARVFAWVCGGLFAASLPVAAVWYANRVHVRFELSSKGVLYRTLEHKDKVANRALVVLGVLFGRPSAAGSGLIAASREAEFTPWAEVTRVKEHPSLNTISLVCGWRVGQRLFCSHDDYPRVAEFVRGHTRQSRQ